MHLHYEFYGLKRFLKIFFFKILSMVKLKTQFQREGDLMLKRGQYRILAANRQLRFFGRTSTKFYRCEGDRTDTNIYFYFREYYK